MERIFFLVASLSIFASGCSVYGPSSRPASRMETPAASSPLSARDTAVIRSYVAQSTPERSRGRGRNGSLPPGIEKNLQRGKTLPPGIAKGYLPADLLVRLPPVSAGFEYVVVAGKLLLVEIATQTIRDILFDAVFDK